MVWTIYAKIYGCFRSCLSLTLQEVINERGKDRKEKGVYKILSHVEKQGGESIKLFWSCVFEDHMVQKYPFLHTLFKSLLEGQSIHFCVKWFFSFLLNCFLMLYWRT